MRRRRSFALAAVVVVIALAIAALASSGGGGHGGGARAKAGAGAAGTAAGHPRTVRFTVEANGDLLIHSPIFDLAQADAHGHGYDFTPMLRDIKPYVSGADLAICHVETPMTPRPPTGYPVFNTPPDLAKAIRSTGWDICDTASNHSLDQGQYGVDQTGRALDRQGIGHTGSFASARARDHVLMVRVKGVKVAFLAYTEMTNGEPLPHPWSVNLARAPRILADAGRARRQGAQVVIVNLHWGEENVAQPSAFQTRLARRLTRSPDITAVIGQHVHVVQPIRAVNGKLVVFGEGNLLSNQTSACCPIQSEDGLMALLHFSVTGSRARLDRIGYVPVWVRHPDFEVLPVGDALRHHLLDAATLRASYKRTASVAGRSSRVQPVPRRLPR